MVPIHIVQSILQKAMIMFRIPALYWLARPLVLLCNYTLQQ